MIGRDTPPEVGLKTQFKPGTSGNIAGRPKGIPNSKERLKRLLELTEKIKNPVTGELEEFSIMEQLDMQIVAKARRGELSAYKEILDRLEGKPDTSLDLRIKELPQPIMEVDNVRSDDGHQMYQISE